MADESPETKPKRQLKNPETFRERAVKANAESEKPTRRRVIRQAPSKVTSPVTQPVGKFFRRLAQIQPFKSIAWVLKWVGRILVPRYLRNSWKELKLVSWPNWKESRRLTYAVLAFAVVFGGVIATVDYGLDKVFKQLLLK